MWSKVIGEMRGLGFAAVLLLGVVGGAHAQTPEEALRERATAYWQARVTGDLASAYGFEAGARPGGGLTPYNYAKMGAGMNLTRLKVLDARVEGDKGVVEISAMLHSPLMAQPFPQRMEDPWVLMEGVWYHQTQMQSGLVMPSNALKDTNP